MNIMVIGSAGFVLIVLFTVLLKMKTKKKKERAMELQAEDKLREAALDKIILNDKGQGNESNIFSAKPLYLFPGIQTDYVGLWLVICIYNRNIAVMNLSDSVLVYLTNHNYNVLKILNIRISCRMIALKK